MLIILILMSIFLLLIIYYSHQLIYPKIHNHQTVLDYAISNNHIEENLLDNYQVENIDISSPFGYSLKGQIVVNENKDKFILLCHGITSNYDGMKKYMEIFLDRGYSILLYDHRNHGYSPKSFTSFGYYEKWDAKACIDLIVDKYKPGIIGVLGESMGAAIAMQLATIDNRLDFCIEDCGFSDAYQLFKLRSSTDNHKVVGILTKPTSYYMKVIYKWSFKDVSVIHTLNQAKCPIMFIHGSEDTYVPFQMVYDLYNSYQGPKKLLTVEGAVHANSVVHKRSLYTSSVNEFLDLYKF